MEQLEQEIKRLKNAASKCGSDNPMEREIQVRAWKKDLRKWKRELERVQKTSDSNPFKEGAVAHALEEIAHVEHILENY